MDLKGGSVMKRCVMFLVALFFLCFLCAPVSAQCFGSRLRTVAKRLDCAVVRVSNRGRCVVRSSVSAAKCTTGAAVGLAGDSVRAVVVTAAKPAQAVRQCVNGQCFK